jgi:hypothetical protein
VVGLALFLPLLLCKAGGFADLKYQPEITSLNGAMS